MNTHVEKEDPTTLQPAFSLHAGFFFGGVTDLKTQAHMRSLIIFPPWGPEQKPLECPSLGGQCATVILRREVCWTGELPTVGGGLRQYCCFCIVEKLKTDVLKNSTISWRGRALEKSSGEARTCVLGYSFSNVQAGSCIMTPAYKPSSRPPTGKWTNR